MNKKEFNIQKLGFHKFHECQTQYKQHWKKDGTDEVVGYRYVERSTEKGGVCVFIPNTISPDDYSQYIKNIVNPIITQNKYE
jgi:hypothetical protein